MKKKTIAIISALITVLVVSILLPVAARAVPQPPHVFRGAVTVGGAVAADGLTVTAAIAGASFSYTPSAQTSGGRYGDDLKFKIPADDPDTSTKEGGVSGDTVVFYVQGVEAGTYTFTVGDVTQLDLSISALPTLATPSNLQRTTPDDDNTPTFTWNAVTSAVSYQLRMDFGSFLDVGNVTTYTFSTAIADGSHTFEVRGVDAQSTPGPSSLSSFTISTAPVLPAVGGGGGGGGGLAGVTSVLYSMAQDGRFTEDITAKSEDGNAELFIPKDTVGKNRMGSLLSSLSIMVMADSPSPPDLSRVIGLVYDVGPDGATFDPPITLTMTYDASLIPEGVAEKNLVVAWWDKNAGQWEDLESTVDKESDIIMTEVGHFTAFAILAYTRPASFTVADLSITPREVNFGEEVSISITVTNTGDLTGSYEVSLKIDSLVVQTEEVTLAGGDSETISFSVPAAMAGEHTVNVNGLPGTFGVKAAPEAPAAFTTSALTVSPAEVNTGESVTISVLVANTGDLTGTYKVILRIDGVGVEAREVTIARGTRQKVTFVTVRNTAGAYSVSIDGLSGSFVVRERIPPVPAPPPPAPAPAPAPTLLPEVPVTKPAGWWLIGGIIVAVVITGLASLLVIRRRS